MTTNLALPAFSTSRHNEYQNPSCTDNVFVVLAPITPTQGWPSGYGGQAVMIVIDPGIACPPPPTTPTSGHVGGELYTANKLAVLSPYLALISVVAVAAVVAKRKFT